MDFKWYLLIITIGFVITLIKGLVVNQKGEAAKAVNEKNTSHLREKMQSMLENHASKTKTILESAHGILALDETNKQLYIVSEDAFPTGAKILGIEEIEGVDLLDRTADYHEAMELAVQYSQPNSARRSTPGQISRMKAGHEAYLDYNGQTVFGIQLMLNGQRKTIPLFKGDGQIHNLYLGHPVPVDLILNCKDFRKKLESLISAEKRRKENAASAASIAESVPTESVAEPIPTETLDAKAFRPRTTSTESSPEYTWECGCGQKHTDAKKYCRICNLRRADMWQCACGAFNRPDAAVCKRCSEPKPEEN